MRHNSRIVYWIVFPNLNVSLERPKELKNAEIEGERVNSLNWQGILRTDRPCLACQPSSQFWVRPRRSSASSAGPIFARWPLIMRMESENLFPLTPFLLSFTQGDRVRDGCLWKGFREAAAFLPSVSLPHCHRLRFIN